MLDVGEAPAPPPALRKASLASRYTHISNGCLHGSVRPMSGRCGLSSVLHKRPDKYHFNIRSKDLHQSHLSLRRLIPSSLSGLSGP